MHDVLEDTDVTVADMTEAGLPLYVVFIVEILTRRKEESYLDYILRVREDTIAVAVKIADIQHNLSTLEQGNMKEKYFLALWIL
ncbi:MAG: GTP pyrophosphokinase, partial [Candidatus Omnitrophota bacterium]